MDAREFIIALALVVCPIPVRCCPSRCRPVPAEADGRSRCLTRETPEEQEREERERESVLCCVLLALYCISIVVSCHSFVSSSFQPSISCPPCLPSSHPSPIIAVHKRHSGNNQINADASAPRPISRATPPSEALLAPALSLPARLSQSPPFSPLILLIFFLLFFLLFFLIVFLLFHPQPSTDRCCYVWGQGPSLSCPAVLQDPSTTTARFYQSCILQH